MLYNGKLEIKSTDLLLKKYGLKEFGIVQKFIDEECIRLMKPYTPRINGKLEDSLTNGTKIGSGKLYQIAPYARYQYYGKLMVSSVTGSAYASKGEKKVLTAKDLNYTKSEHPLAGAFWFDRMKADKKDQILKGVQEIIKRQG